MEGRAYQICKISIWAEQKDSFYLLTEKYSDSSPPPPEGINEQRIQLNKDTNRSRKGEKPQPAREDEKEGHKWFVVWYTGC